MVRHLTQANEDLFRILQYLRVYIVLLVKQATIL